MKLEMSMCINIFVMNLLCLGRPQQTEVIVFLPVFLRQVVTLTNALLLVFLQRSCRQKVFKASTTTQNLKYMDQDCFHVPFNVWLTPLSSTLSTCMAHSSL